MSGWRQFVVCAAAVLAVAACSNIPIVPSEPATGTRGFEPSRLGAERATAYALSAPSGSIRYIALAIAPEISDPAQSRWIKIGSGTVRDRSKSETCAGVSFCFPVNKLTSLVVYDSRSVERGGQPEASVHRFASMLEVEAWYAKDPIFEKSSASRRQAPLFAEIAPTARDVRDGHAWEWEAVHTSKATFDDTAFCGLLAGGSDPRCVAFADMRNLTLIGPGLPARPFPATNVGARAMLAEAAVRGSSYIGFERRVRIGMASRDFIVLRSVSEISADRICGLVADMPDAAQIRCFSLKEISILQVVERDPSAADPYTSYGRIPEFWIIDRPFSVIGSASGIKPIRPGAPVGDLTFPEPSDGDFATVGPLPWIEDDDCPFCLY